MNSNCQCTTGEDRTGYWPSWKGRQAAAKRSSPCHSHLTLEERTSNEVFVAMAMSCRKVAVYPGRSHTSACRELRQGSSKSGSCARNTKHRTPKEEQCRAMTAAGAFRNWSLTSKQSCTSTGFLNKLQAYFPGTSRGCKQAYQRGDHLPPFAPRSPTSQTARAGRAGARTYFCSPHSPVAARHRRECAALFGSLCQGHQLPPDHGRHAPQGCTTAE